MNEKENDISWKFYAFLTIVWVAITVLNVLIIISQISKGDTDLTWIYVIITATSAWLIYRYASNALEGYAEEANNAAESSEANPSHTSKKDHS